MKKTFGKIKIILNVLLTIFVILFLLMVCLQRFTNNEISFLNYRMFTVASGSMAPEYEVGDVLIARETKARELLLTHFFPEEDKKKYVDEAKEYFSNTSFAEENKVYKIGGK